MIAETESLILEILKNIQGRLTRIELDIADIKARQSAMEANIGQLYVLLGTMSGRMDRLEERVSRIERRLDLLEA